MSETSRFLSLLARVVGQSLKTSMEKRDQQGAEQNERLRRVDVRFSEALEAATTRRPSAGSGQAGYSEAVPPVSQFGRRTGGSVPLQITEDITVVLRRQVPVRHGEPPRSWLGGLPVMPDHVEWPCGTNPEAEKEGARPLHFVAQISCADLPAELWNGLGPRSGWLLFFLNNNTATQDDSETHRVIYVESWGRERQPPADIGQVHDGVYTGSQFRSYLDQADVPSVWRRWPIDLVAFPNQLHHDGPRSFGTPPDFAATLYEGQPVGADADRAPTIQPFSWRCLEGARKFFDATASTPSTIHRNEQVLRDKLVAQGPLTSVLNILDVREAKFDTGETARLLAADPAEIEEGRRPELERIRKSRQERLDKRTAIAEFIAEYPDHQAMLDFLETERMRRARWRASAAERFVELNAVIDATDPDTPLAPDRWVEIRDAFEHDCFTGWFPAYLGGSSVILEKQTETTWKHLGSRVMSAVHEIAADCYVDPSRRQLVPDDAVALLEPWWRKFYNNRPHRMGGYHDGVQSDAEEGPTDKPLLLQLATDDAMQWCWGDAGAVYWFVPTTALASGTLDGLDCQIECH